MTVSTFAASSMPPAFPERAGWGTAQSLRAWQQQALEAYFGKDGSRSGPRDFLAAATTGGGRRTVAGRRARELMQRRTGSAMTAMCPIEYPTRRAPQVDA